MMATTEQMILICDHTEPPGCCRYVTLAEWRVGFDDRSRRVTEVIERALDAQPAVCPRCAVPGPIPTFRGREWQCADPGCGHRWEVEHGR